MKLSIVIITLNEEANLRRCLSSVPEGSEIIVVDSGSTDQTLEVAKEFGARTFTNTFVDYASQKNFACDQATGEWIFSIDADETIDRELEKDVLETISKPLRYNAFRVRRSLFFMGKKLSFGKTTDWPIRLFKRDKARFEGEVHEKLAVDGETSTLNKGKITHFSYDDLSDYFQRFNKYTSMVAKKNQASGKKASKVNLYGRFWVEFFTRYIARLGILDGYPGYCYALISSFYAYMKYAKLDELEKLKHG